jgi:hypothetical protein
MISTAEIELIGYVGKDPIFPKPNEYPHFVTFSVGVSRTWKDKEGNEKKKQRGLSATVIRRGLQK